VALSVRDEGDVRKCTARGIGKTGGLSNRTRVQSISVLPLSLTRLKDVVNCREIILGSNICLDQDILGGLFKN